MLKFCLAVILAVLTLTFQTASTFASCAPPASVSENTARADLVVTGKVTNLTDNYALLEVQTYYKGQGPDLLKVSGRISPTSVSSVDFEFAQGSRYLLFLKGNSSDTLLTNSCDGSRVLTSGLSQEEQSSLGSGATPSAKPVAQGTNIYLTYYALASGLLVGLLLYLLHVRKII